MKLIIALVLLFAHVNSAASYLTINRCTNCSPVQWSFIQEAQAKTNRTVASTCFAAFMLERDLIETLDRTNQQVIDSLIGVAVDVEMYFSFRRVLGYTYPGVNKVWINRRYMMSWNQCDLASLLGHEASHKLGYTHAVRPTPTRPFSVPYSMNAAIEACCVR